MSTAVKLAESGWLPDWLLRYSMRRLCRQRLREEDRGDSEANQARLLEFAEHLRSSPIALVPEKANQQHYTLPPEFFGLVLGPHRKYSCCFWESGTRTLAEAEEQSLAITCERAEIQDGQKILDLGCGWGSLSLWIARRFPRSHVTAVSNSAQQRMFIEQAAREHNFENLRVITADMNRFQPDGTFDRIVSVEMFEHMRNYEELFARIARWLATDGKMFVHIFSHRELAYPFEVQTDQASGVAQSDSGDWMSRHFFTGGIMPSDDLLSHFQRDVKIVNRWRWGGDHYETTSLAWLANLDRHHSQALQLLATTYGQKNAHLWLQRWRMFFLACASLFGFRRGREWGVSHYLFERSNGL